MTSITSLRDLVAAVTNNTYNTQSAGDGTSLTTLRVNPTSYALAGSAAATASQAAAVVTASVVAGTGSSAATFVTGGVTVVVVQGPAGPPGDPGPQGAQGATGATGTPVDVIPLQAGHAGEFLTTTGTDLAWLDLQSQLTALQQKINTSITVNNIIWEG